ncbi:MAG TPA: twin-arginine translocase TatA/TatE family subunit [Meiothermus sp.]|jgi:sec-independent protein translocase protein TatA|nr:twin-arginine translocase TatA/TatE family subunit [Meiothermus sp.]
MNLGMPEILIILVVALLLFGPRKLPELGRSLGQSIREFKKGAQSIREEFESTVSLEDKPKPLTTPASPKEEPIPSQTENKS